MVEVQDEIRDAGAEIIWVLEQSPIFAPGTADLCVEFFEGAGATTGWCVGDAETLPDAGTFDESPFSEARGFDMIVPRRSMEIVYTTSHGTPSGNENPSGADVLAELQDIVANLPEPE